jgi:hypothetical protein
MAPITFGKDVTNEDQTLPHEVAKAPCQVFTLLILLTPPQTRGHIFKLPVYLNSPQFPHKIQENTPFGVLSSALEASKPGSVFKQSSLYAPSLRSVKQSLN